jgi:hypothetical protein
MKTTKISSGTYIFTYKNQQVTISKIYHEHYKKYQWYSKINDNNVDDFVDTKKDAIAGALYMIDNPQEYDLKLN